MAGILGAGLVAALTAFVLPRDEQKTLVVDFDRTISLYEGSKVRILGVDVGEVESLDPRGTSVRVTMSWDAQYDIPADVQAVIVSPSVVGDRFVQLTPAYSGEGPTLDDGAFLDQSRTAVPTELDETIAAVDEMATLLGPEGANAEGDLSRLLESSADNLEGKGPELRRSIRSLARLTETADGTKEELFGSVEKIEALVAALETNDAAVRKFNASLADVSTVLADESDDLQLALRTLAGTLSDVQIYVKDNRKVLKRSVDGLAEVTGSLAAQRRNLKKLLQRGPDALANLAAAYNPTLGTIDARATIRGEDGRWFQMTEPLYVQTYCFAASDQNPEYRETCSAVGQVLEWMALQVPGAGQDEETRPVPSGENDTPPADGSDAVPPSADGGLADAMGVA
ncbi:MCE family protein [Mumia flava]|uniref:MCE family protein n=1 Tax=Mumia flava TaxID=1348852 RepID=UPI0012FE47EE|nr:MCE family protein [Mumia flava]